METKPKIDFEALAAEVLKFEQNQIISHDYFDKLFKLETPKSTDFEDDTEFFAAINNKNFQYMSMMQKLISFMLENHKVFLKNERGAGYFICEPNEQVKHGITHTENIVKSKLRKGTKIIINVNYDEVDIVVKKQASDKSASWSAIRQIMKEK